MVYLNNAATSWPKAPGVVEAVRRSLEEPAAEANRGGRHGENPVERCRERLARLFAVPDATRIVLCCGATAALNLAIQGLELKAGDRVLTGAAEHNSVLRPLEKLRRERAQ